ncbi:MAG: pyridoxal phosphate-dependent aminotransferase, partial [Marinosulfonomonas sp.]|nr:pyridoxal phosphate-dependent aminotransferase [Marinosulfonomonas sp.]
MNFDDIIERRNTHCAKWDMMEPVYGVPKDDGIAMWVADMDFRPPPCVQDALQNMLDHGVYGYFGDDSAYKASIQWWMKNRHGWDVDAASIFTTHGLVNGTALCVDAFTDAGDGVVLFTPVYHAFAKVINAAGRKVVECPLVNNDGRYEMDFAAYDAQMTGVEKMLILCSPHNPGGRVWSVEELQGVADFARRHDLVLVSDEIHHDLVFSGAKHTVMPLVDASISDRLVMMTAVTKTFNIAGAHVGNVIISDDALREKYIATMNAGKVSANRFGYHMAEAAYNGGEEWLDDWCEYMAENKRIFDEGINAIPGLRSMNLEATYLAWVDFADTGMTREEFTDRVVKIAKVAPNVGATFGKGGENFLRFNIATRRELVEKAVKRIAAAFADLQ